MLSAYYNKRVKYLLAALILAFFLPLQSDLRCSDSGLFSPRVFSCSKSSIKNRSSQLNLQPIFEHSLRQTSRSSECNSCNSGICGDLVALSQSLLSNKYGDWADAQCAQPLQFDFPMELFFLPHQQRPEPSKKQRASNFLSHYFLQVTRDCSTS